MAKQKFYVVWKGHETGIFDSWAECQRVTKGFPSAEFKSFPSREIAEKEYEKRGSSIEKLEDKKNELNNEINYESICVDGACAGNPGNGEYQCVDVKTGNNIFLEVGFDGTTNNIMEFLALVDALKWLKENEDDRPVYSDSITAMAWVRNKKCKSTLKENEKNFDSIRKIEDAEKWLKENSYKTEIIKWNTKEWGEIPADFGRK